MEYTIYLKKNTLDDSDDTIGYMVKWWELPFVLIHDNLNIKKIVKD